MSGNVTALEGSHVIGKYRDESIMHTCSRHAGLDFSVQSKQVLKCGLQIQCAIKVVAQIGRFGVVE